MKFDIFKTDAHLTICPVWANHSDSPKLFVLGGLNELEDFPIARDENVAFLEFCFYCHISIK